MPRSCHDKASRTSRWRRAGPGIAAERRHYPRDCERMASTSAFPWQATHEMNLVYTAVNAAIARRADPDRVNIHWPNAPADGDCCDDVVTKRHVLLKTGGLHRHCCWPK